MVEQDLLFLSVDAEQIMQEHYPEYDQTNYICYCVKTKVFAHEQIIAQAFFKVALPEQ